MNKTEYVPKRLAEIVGEQNCLTSLEDRIVYAFDARAPAEDQLPLVVVLPSSTEEVSQIVKFANQERIPVVARGSGTGLAGAAVPCAGCIVLSTTRMDRILEIDTANLTALVEPGVRNGQLAAAVEALGLFYPPDPGTMAISTIGGNVNTNAGGLRGLKYGVTGDFVSGLEVVLANGDILHTGGKCKKDVAGYNLTSLFVGSEGTLGIVTQILLRLLPLPEARRTATAFFMEIESAAQVVADIIAARIIPVTLEILDDMSIQCVDDYAQLGLPRDAGAMLLIEVDGPASQLDVEIAQITAICQKNAATHIEVAKDEAHAERLKAARRTTLAALARRRPTTILEDVTVPRSHIPDMVKRIREISSRYRVEMAIFGHAGDGNLHPTGMTDARDEEELGRVEKAFAEIYQAALEMGGTITGEHGIGTKKRRFLPALAGTVGMQTMTSIKKALDPNNILNPGKIFLT